MAGEKDFRKARGAILRGETAMMANTRDEIVRLLKEAAAHIRVILAGQPTDYQLWALPRLQTEIRQVLAQFGEDAAARISSAAGQAWELGGESIVEPLRAGGVLQGVAFQAIDQRQLLAMRAFATDRIKGIGLDAANRINAELGRVVIGAQGPSDAISAVTQILGEASRARATTIVRTSLGQVFSAASFERVGRVAAAVPGLKKQWIRSGKLHPRLNHAAIDKQIQDVGDPFILNGGALKMMYPLDPAAPAAEVINCGCRMVAYKADWNIDRPARGGPAAGPSLRELIAAGG
jgi:hypothetical protein